MSGIFAALLGGLTLLAVLFSAGSALAGATLGIVACPNLWPATGHVEREIQAVLSRCKDPTAAAPRCSCG